MNTILGYFISNQVIDNIPLSRDDHEQDKGEYWIDVNCSQYIQQVLILCTI